VAHRDRQGRGEQRGLRLQRPEFHDADGRGADVELGNPRFAGSRWDGRALPRAQAAGWADGGEPHEPGVAGFVGQPASERRAWFGEKSAHGESRQAGEAFWSDIEWLPCRDDKWRPTKPGLFPLAHGVSNRVAQLRAIGNAIVPQVAAEFIRAALDL
jgi:DNA (cytosine-5)-methyltransferase 1